MRIAVAGFYHETNAFGSVLVDYDLLHANMYEGQKLLDFCQGTRTYLGGVIDEAAEQKVELLPTVLYRLLPSGPVQEEVMTEALNKIVDMICDLHEKTPLDGIALPMHGAGAAPGYPDIEGSILRALRERLGSEIPIGVCLDLHANVTRDMLELSDILIGVRSYPHIDEYETAREMVTMLCDLIRTGKKPAKALVTLPWLLATALGSTVTGPCADIREYCLAKEAEEEGLLRASVCHGFPYSDVPFAGVSVVTMAKTQEAADRTAREIARYAWSRRNDFDVRIYSAEGSVDAALAYGEGPVIINEASDNPGGGTPGDGTHLLRELLKRDVSAAFGFIFDKEVPTLAKQAGVGATISCLLGGKTDNLHGEPIELKDAYVRCISDGVFVRRPPMGAGRKVCLGTTVCLEVGNVSIVVADGMRTQTFDDGPFRIAGVDWQRKRILALKSSHHFKAWWSDKVRAIVPCESPGVHSADLRTLPLRNADLTKYPLGDPSWEG